MKKSCLKLLITICITFVLTLIISVGSSANYDYYNCQHNYNLVSADNYYVTFECSNCQQQQSGYIPYYINAYTVNSIQSNSISYSYGITSEYTAGEKITIYLSEGYASYYGLELTASKNDIVKITELDVEYYDNIYELEFLKEGSVDITVTSKYNSNIEYATYSFKSICEHSYKVLSADGYYVTMECEKCKQQQSGSIPSDVTVYNIFNNSLNTDIPSEYKLNSKVQLYISPYYADYQDIEVKASKSGIVKITKAEHEYYSNVYQLEFIKCAPGDSVDIIISSKYNSDVVYSTLTFKAYCEHNYEVEHVLNYEVKMVCTKCKDIKTGSIPEEVWTYNVSSYTDSGMSYSSYIPSSFNVGDNLTICVEKSSAYYSDIEFIITNPSVLEIKSVPHNYYEFYSFNFKKAGITNVLITSAYDNNVVYKIMTFISDGYDSYYGEYISFTGEKDRAGDVDGNGTINATDARLALRLSAKLCTCNTTTNQYADANGDGKITSSDARLILRVSARLANANALSEFYVVDSSDSSNGNYNRSKTVSLRIGETLPTDTYIIRGNNVKVSSSNTSVAIVEKKTNKVKAVRNGYTCITVTNGTETFEYELFVLDKNDSLDNYQYGTPKIKLTIGDRYKINYIILKDTKNLTWKSSNPSVATVDKNGNIKALKKGYTCIIVSNGKDSCYYDINVTNELQEKIDLYREKYPHGYYWNNHTPSKKYPNVTEQPCTDHKNKKYQYCKGQCAGFADLMFREIYGKKAKKHYGVTWNNIEIGDYIRLNPHHSVFVTDVVKKGDIIGYSQWENKNIVADRSYIVVVHCNWGSCCNIAWDDVFYEGSYSINSSASYSAQ